MNCYGIESSEFSSSEFSSSSLSRSYSISLLSVDSIFSFANSVVPRKSA